MASAARKATGALRVVVHRSGTTRWRAWGSRQSSDCHPELHGSAGDLHDHRAGWQGDARAGVRVRQGTPSTVTVTFPGVPVTASAIAAGGSGTCALLPDGTVTCWEHEKWPTPVPVNGITTATAITADQSHTCALLSNGTVTCWGDNSYGQLGNGTTTSSPAPVAGHRDRHRDRDQRRGRSHLRAAVERHRDAAGGGTETASWATADDQHANPVTVYRDTTATAISAGVRPHLRASSNGGGDRPLLGTEHRGSVGQRYRNSSPNPWP